MTVPSDTSVDVSSPQWDESAMLARLRAGDEAAFTEVVGMLGPRLLAVAHRFLQNEADAQDAVQDALISAFRSLGHFQGESRLATWLHRITVNASLMKLRTRRRHPERPIEDLLPAYLPDGHRADVERGWSESPDDAMAAQETRDLVRRCIGDLPESYRIVLVLRDIEGHSTEETADLLEIEPGAVKTRLHRARQALRNLLDPYMRGDLL